MFHEKVLYKLLYIILKNQTDNSGTIIHKADTLDIKKSVLLFLCGELYPARKKVVILSNEISLKNSHGLRNLDYANSLLQEIDHVLL